jgi:hypothetical protein
MDKGELFQEGQVKYLRLPIFVFLVSIMPVLAHADDDTMKIEKGSSLPSFKSFIADFGEKPDDGTKTAVDSAYE